MNLEILKKKRKPEKEQQGERPRKICFMKKRRFKMVREGEWEQEEYQRHNETKCLTP